MQVYSDKVYEILKKNIEPIFLVAGDDILQKNETCDLIRNACFRNGYERQRFSLEPRFDWQAFQDNLNTLSLFSNKRLIELHLNDSKINTQGVEVVLNFCQDPSLDTVLLICSNRIEGNPKWVKKIIEAGVYVPIYPLDSKRLPQWLKSRAKKINLELSYDAAELLATKVEGNLTAANQELEKLSLLLPKNSLVDRKIISTAVADNSKFSTFECFDVAIEGNTFSACRSLRRIREEGIEPSAIIGALAYLLRNISQLKSFLDKNDLENGLKILRIQKKKQKFFIKLINTISIDEIVKFTKLCSIADIKSKTSEKEESWFIIEIILVSLSQRKMPLELYLDIN